MEQVFSGSTALAGLILVFLGGLYASYETIEPQHRRAVRDRYVARIWFTFIGFVATLASAGLALSFSWFHTSPVFWGSICRTRNIVRYSGRDLWLSLTIVLPRLDWRKPVVSALSRVPTLLGVFFALIIVRQYIIDCKPLWKEFFAVQLRHEKESSGQATQATGRTVDSSPRNPNDRRRTGAGRTGG